MDKISQLSVENYLEKMAICDFPGPAAGSAAATAAAMAAALLEMSCHGSLKKNKENVLLKESMELGCQVRQTCLDLADADMEAYGRVIQAAKVKKADPQGYEVAMKEATEPFLAILGACHTLLKQIDKVVESSFSQVLGDLVGGVYLAEAAAAASKSGIEVNLSLIKDLAFKEKHLPEARSSYQACVDLKKDILKQVFGAEKQVHPQGQKVLDFWFDPQNQAFWFEKNEAFDQKIRAKFNQIWLDGCSGLLSSWRQTIEGRLAEIIVLDQFSRNLNRDNEKAFSQDLMALVLAQEAIRDPGFSSLPVDHKRFILMPMMHSEAAAIHEMALPLFESLGEPLTLDYEIKHKAIIDRFGRYPHRNVMKKLESTPEEIEFLKGPDSSF